MTADLAYTDPGLHAWTLAANPRHLPVQRTTRAALVYAAEQAALDPEWLTDARHRVIHDIVHIGVIPELDHLFDLLIAATIIDFAPKIFSCVDDLVTPNVGESA